MGTPSVCVDKITHMAPDFSKFLRLRPHDALAASTKITIFTCGTGHAKHVRTRGLQNTVTHYDMIFNKGMAEERKVILRTRKIQLLSWCCIFLLQKHDTPHFPVRVCVLCWNALTSTTTAMGPAKLQISVSWTESQQKSGLP